MRVYCSLGSSSSLEDKQAMFTSQQIDSKVLVVSTRPIKRSIAAQFKKDRDLKVGLGLLKSCVFYGFDRIFKGPTQ